MSDRQAALEVVKAAYAAFANRHLFALRDGLITAFREYSDTAAQLVVIHPSLQGTTSPEKNLHD